ncbi:MAG TPA: class I SAM-dependent methyltransferase, partial [Polyangiaceae bacterium]
RTSRGAPAIAVAVQAALALAMVATSSFGMLLAYIGFTLSVCAGLTVLGAFSRAAARSPVPCVGLPGDTAPVRGAFGVDGRPGTGRAPHVIARRHRHYLWRRAALRTRRTIREATAGCRLELMETTMRYVSFLIAAVVMASSPLHGVRAEDPAQGSTPPGVHESANLPIDCPLHKQGVSTGALRPFAETEKYIEFLERSDRARWQKPDEVVAALHLEGTETLADVGAGSGYFTFRFAKALPRGKVIASDVDAEMVRHVHHKVLSDGIANVQVVLADPKDPGVSPAADVVFVCDVIHHVQGREAWLQKMFTEMKPGAKLAVIEFKEGKLPEGPPETVKIPKAKLSAMLRDVGFVLKSDAPELLPYQTFLVFQKPLSSRAKTSMK